MHHSLLRFHLIHPSLQQPVQETDGRAVLLSLSPVGSLPGCVRKNQEHQIPSLLFKRLISQTFLLQALAFGMLQDGATPLSMGLTPQMYELPHNWG